MITTKHKHFVNTEDCKLNNFNKCFKSIANTRLCIKKLIISQDVVALSRRRYLKILLCINFPTASIFLLR